MKLPPIVPTQPTRVQVWVPDACQKAGTGALRIRRPNANSPSMTVAPTVATSSR